MNDRIARAITAAVGTMWCAYVFAALALVSLPSVIRTGDPVQIVGWTAQTFLQLVLLSVILVGQRLAEERRSELHDKVDDLHAKVDDLT